MVAIGDFAWRLSGASPADADIISAVLDLDAAKLSYGPFRFDFGKVRLPRGELNLTLAPAVGADAVDRLALGCPEQVIPCAAAHLPAEERKSLEARYLEVLGRALFDDVARLVRLEMEFR